VTTSTARFFHQFAALLNAGIPVQQGLGMAGRDCDARFQRALNEASLKIEAGEELGTALRSSQVPIDRWSISMVQAAEYSGALPQACEQIAIALDTQEKRKRLYRSVGISAALVILGSFALLVALLQRGTGFLGQPWFWLFSVILASVPLIAVAFTSSDAFSGADAVSQEWYALAMKFPLLRGVLQTRSVLYLAELELPLRCGISLLRAIDLMRRRIPDPVLAKNLEIASRQIQSGKTLHQSLTGKLPAIALQMIRTGEETGNLDEMLAKLGEYYEGELERKLKQIQGILRPLGVLAAGGIVLLLGMQMLASLQNALPG
jgi:type II secretory pathway component PulF